MSVYLPPALGPLPVALASALRLRNGLPLTSATLEREALDAFADVVEFMRDGGLRPHIGRPRSYSAPPTFTAGAPPGDRVMFQRTYGESQHVNVPVLPERIALSFANPVGLALMTPDGLAVLREPHVYEEIGWLTQRVIDTLRCNSRNTARCPPTSTSCSPDSASGDQARCCGLKSFVPLDTATARDAARCLVCGR